MTRLGDILILGLGTSGEAAARYCAALPDGEVSSLTLVDGADSPRLRALAEEFAALGARVVLGASAIDGRYDLCVASPGIAPHADLMRSAREACTEVISELEFAYRRSNNVWVAVTGTNGKTTTTALVTHLLRSGGVLARSIGNYGPAAIGAVADPDPSEVLVAEVSSFQLALTERFHPRVALLLNVTPDHIDWHGSFEAYALDKARVFANMGHDDTAIVDVDDEGSAPFADKVAGSGAAVVRVSRSRAFDGGATLDAEMLVLDLHGTCVPLVTVDELRIRGAHNVSNALAAAAAAHALGVKPHAIRDGLRTFEPIEHRLEPVGEACGAEWFNDSKATNPDAVMKALSAFGSRPLVLLLGGRNKGNDFRPLAAEAGERARAVVVFGEARDDISAAFAGMDVELSVVPTLADAVGEAARIAREGDAVVLSPACASFDEFTSYEHRGRYFKERVAGLTCGEAS